MTRFRMTKAQHANGDICRHIGVTLGQTPFAWSIIHEDDPADAGALFLVLPDTVTAAAVAAAVASYSGPPGPPPPDPDELAARALLSAGTATAAQLLQGFKFLAKRQGLS